MKNLIDVVDDLEAGRLVRILPEYTLGSGEIHLVFPSRRYRPARIRKLTDVLVEAFKLREARCTRWLTAAAR